MPDLIGDLTAELHSLRDEIKSAYGDLETNEQAWLDKYDAVFESMREDGQAVGRKSDPSEHAVTSAARRKYPAEYKAWRDAKLELRRLEGDAENVRSQISAHQTRANQAGRLPTVQPQRRAA